MDKGLAYIVTIVVCILLQLAIAPAIAIAGATPVFLLIPVLLISMRSGAGAGGVAGFLLGLLYDFSGEGVIGVMALTFCVVALIVGLAGSAMESSPAMGAIVGAIFGFFVPLMHGVVTILGSSATSSGLSTMFTYAVPSGVYTAVICAVALLTMGMVVVSDAPQMGSKLGGGFGKKGGFLG